MGFNCQSLRFDCGKGIGLCLLGSSIIAIFVSTAGKELDEQLKKYSSEDDLLSYYVVDISGSVIVEQVAEKIHKKIATYATEIGLKSTNRYSPGYCFWDVAEQHKLFSLLPKITCGITLTSSALMLPTKSISGVVGIGLNVSTKAYGCKFCDMEDCLFTWN